MNPDDTDGPIQINCCSPAYQANDGSGDAGIADCFANHPTMPYCDMVDCVNSLCPDPTNTTGMTCCEPIVETCECACNDFILSQGWPIPLLEAGSMDK